MTFSIPEFFKVAVAALGVLFLVERPARADVMPSSFITINDALPDDSIQVTWSGLFTSFMVSSNCVNSGTAASGSANCASEALPIILTADGPGPPGSGPNTLNVNIWENSAHTLLSDTLAITASTNPDGTAHGVLTFQSDVDGGPALTPLTGVEGVTLFTFEEGAGGTLPALLGPNSANPTLLSVTVEGAEVPEPSSLLLLGSCLVTFVGLNRWRKRA